jgi:hypothetical protein
MPTTANEFIEQQLSERLKALEDVFESDALCINGPLVYGTDDLVRTVIEDMRQEGSRKRLAIVLTTDGGYIEPVQRIVETIRHYYDHVSFIIPNYAFSAGTILVMSGDEIYMDYYSRLGPIDPQLPTQKGRLVPALGYVKQWKRLLKRAQEGTLTTVEAQLMIEGFDQAELYEFEQTVELSVTLLKEWLVKYKFKNWTKTATRGQPVTEEMRERRAEEIALELNNTDRWHSHGYGISMAVLQRDLNLQIDDLDCDPDRRDRVKLYHNLLSDYMQKLGNQGVFHRVGRYLPYM